MITQKSRVFFNHLPLLSLGVLAIFLFFFLLEPRVNSILIPQARKSAYQQLLNDLGGGSIDVQKFWKFRDMYSPGFFRLDKSALKTVTPAKLKRDSLNAFTATTAAVFAVYSSRDIQSIDAYIEPIGELNEIGGLFVILFGISRKQVISQGYNFVLYAKGPKTVELIFARPLSEEISTLGDSFLNNIHVRKNILMTKYWLDISTIELN